VPHGDVHQFAVAALEGGVKNDSHVHHNVDEQRIIGHERS